MLEHPYGTISSEILFFIRDVQRLSRKRVEPSGPKRKVSFI
nr:MAG TPA: hypothetical protein [Caudoviricetes sp.]